MEDEEDEIVKETLDTLDFTAHLLSQDDEQLTINILVEYLKELQHPMEVAALALHLLAAVGPETTQQAVKDQLLG